MVLTGAADGTPLTVTAAAGNRQAAAAQPEIDTYTLGGTIEIGDTYTLTVGGETFTYTVPDPAPANATDLATAIVAALDAAAADNADPQNTAAVAVKAAATVEANAGTVELTGAAEGTALAVTMDAGNKAAQAEVDTYTLGGTIEAGDTYTLTVGGNTFTYTVPDSAPANATDLATAIVAASDAAAADNADPQNTAAVAVKAAATVEATAGTVVLTGAADGTPLTVTAAAGNRQAAAAQPEIDTYTLGGTIEIGDTYTLTVGGETFTYTVPDPAPANATDLATAIVAALDAAAADNADPQNTAAVAVKAAATVEANADTVVLTGAAEGTPLAVTAAAANITGGTDDQGATKADTTPGATGVAADSPANVGDADTIINFQAGTDKLDLPTATVASNVSDSGNVSPAEDVTHGSVTIGEMTITDGVVTFDNETGALAPINSLDALTAALAYLGNELAEGDTVAFNYDIDDETGTWVFQGHAQGDIAVRLVGEPEQTICGNRPRF
ncbi:hypothetical protein Thiosp_02940 [Thiorhodovibrio litoralis]|nr:hypothetical protein Thiosp_02940 [Thiorhodovibrio litoralis]